MNFMKTVKTLAAAAAILAALAMSPAVQADDGRHTGRGTGPVIFVTSQGLYFDSIVLATLPMKGPFQKLEMGGTSGLFTEFGPGDVEYVDGRWWMDVNGDGEMDSEDLFFSCPLLGPGRAES